MKLFDRYGHSLNLSFAGEDNYKTRLGGSVSVLVYLVTIVFAYSKVMQLYNKTDPTIATTQKTIAFDKTALNLGENNFDIMVAVG